MIQRLIGRRGRISFSMSWWLNQAEKAPTGGISAGNKDPQPGRCKACAMFTGLTIDVAERSEAGRGLIRFCKRCPPGPELGLANPCGCDSRHNVWLGSAIQPDYKRRGIVASRETCASNPANVGITITLWLHFAYMLCRLCCCCCSRGNVQQAQLKQTELKLHVHPSRVD